VKLARTSAEAHLYMDLTPCGCGDHRFERQSAVVMRGDVMCSQYTGPCATCGTIRTFVFRLPEEILAPAPGRIRFGGAEPSQLLDPGEWLAVADDFAKRNPVDVPPARRARAREDLATAVAALEEVLKFAGGADRVPDAAFVSERGRAVRDAEPGRFRVIRLEAVLGAYRELLAGLEGS
jgi:hypothetical protein